MEPKTISLMEFQANLNAMLEARLAKGHQTMEMGDLGDLIGSLIACENEAEMKDAHDMLTWGVKHGIGLSHGTPNSPESIKAAIAHWQQLARQGELPQ